MPVEFENDEEKKATRLVQDMLVQQKETQLIVRMLDRLIRAPKIRAKVGQINQDIYRHNCKSQNEDQLSKLPVELQREIWAYLITPADRLILALTCKAHATVFEELKKRTQRSGALKKSAKPATVSKRTPKTVPAQSKPPTKMEKLYVLYRLRSWMPAKYRLCCECVRFRSKTRAIRKVALVFGAREAWSGRALQLEANGQDEKAIMQELKEAIKTGSRCPECCQRAQLDTISAKEAHQKLKMEMAKML